jgi:hypothetical protein
VCGATGVCLFDPNGRAFGVFACMASIERSVVPRLFLLEGPIV